MFVFAFWVGNGHIQIGSNKIHGFYFEIQTLD